MLNVLLIDNEQTLLEVTSAYLKRKGDMSCEMCLSTREARNKLAEKKYDAIVCDYDMPDENGIDFLKSLKDENNPIPFILFTGKSREEIAIAAINNGADFYLQKRGDVKTLFGELILMIEKSVDKARKINKTYHLNDIFFTLKETRKAINESKNTDSMLKSVSKTIIDSKGYYNVRIVLFDIPGNITGLGHSGFGEDFNEILEWLKKGELTGCAKRALETKKVIYSEKCSISCKECPLRSIHEDKGAITACLEYENKIYGIISVTIPSVLVSDPDEHSLFEELARDISDSIHAYELEDDKLYRNTLKTAGNKLNNLNNTILEKIFENSTCISENLDQAGIILQNDALKYLEQAVSANESIKSEILFARDYQNLGLYEPKWQNIRDIFMEKSKILSEKNVDFEINTGNLEILADPMLEMIFVNLMFNSILHGKEVSRIKMHSYTKDDCCYIIFEDNGVGVKDYLKDRIFERNFGKCNGFGLFLTKEILEITGISIKECGFYMNGAKFQMKVPEYSFRNNDFLESHFIQSEQSNPQKIEIR